MKRYQKRMQQFPLSLPRGPRAQLDAAYEELQRDVVRPPSRERPANKWITDKVWRIVDKRALLRRKGMRSQAAAHSLGREIRARLKADRLLRAATTASNVEGCLAAGEYIEAWCHLKGWYRSAEDRAPTPCPETLAVQTQKRIDLYAARQPSEVMLPLHVDPAPVPDAEPTDSELRMVVGKLRNGCAAGATGMKTEHLKEWLANVKREEREEGGVDGLGDRWRSFVALLRAVWTTKLYPPR